MQGSITTVDRTQVLVCRVYPSLTKSAYASSTKLGRYTTWALDPTTSFLTAAALIYAIGAGITAGAGTRLVLQLLSSTGLDIVHCARRVDKLQTHTISLRTVFSRFSADSSESCWIGVGATRTGENQ